MTVEEHRELHKKLHRSLDGLLADFLTETRCQELPSDTTIMRLVEWSCEQTQNPSDIQEMCHE